MDAHLIFGDPTINSRCGPMQSGCKNERKKKSAHPPKTYQKVDIIPKESGDKGTFLHDAVQLISAP